jgi:cell division protein FtsW (lipid II flippase)
MSSNISTQISKEPIKSTPVVGPVIDTQLPVINSQISKAESTKDVCVNTNGPSLCNLTKNTGRFEVLLPNNRQVVEENTVITRYENDNKYQLFISYLILAIIGLVLIYSFVNRRKSKHKNELNLIIYLFVFILFGLLVLAGYYGDVQSKSRSSRYTRLIAFGLVLVFTVLYFFFRFSFNRTKDNRKIGLFFGLLVIILSFGWTGTLFDQNQNYFCIDSPFMYALLYSIGISTLVIGLSV